MPFIAEFKPGEDVVSFFQVGEKSLRRNRAGKPYLDLLLRDRTGSLPAKVWDVTEEVAEAFGPGDFVKALGTVELFQESPQLRVRKVRKVEERDYEEGFDPRDCVEATPGDVEAMWAELLALSESCSPKVAELLALILQRFQSRVRRWPAAHHIHHPYLGGWLEHTLAVARTCAYFAERYPVSRDLMVAGGILHDVGKLEELSVEGGFDYTAVGRLVGHTVLGRDILREEAARVEGFPPETLLHLEHILLAHQGEPDWGAVKPPMTPEALLVHYADDADAKFNIVWRALEQDKTESDFTGRHPILGRYLYKPRPPGPDEAGGPPP